MVAFVIIVLCLVIWGTIEGYEYFLKRMYIAKIVDGQKVSGNYVGEPTQQIMEMMKDLKSCKMDKYTNVLIFPDGQKLSYLTDTMDLFKKNSELNYIPTKIEWEIMRLYFRKIHNLS